MARNNKGFTLIELLIVITIIGVLSTVLVLMNTATQVKKARDARRESDLNQYRIALENYASAYNGVYPIAAAGAVSSICPNPLNTNFIATCLTDPVGGTYVYKYWSDGSDYILWGGLERGGFWEICANGKSGKSATEPTGACNL